MKQLVHRSTSSIHKRSIPIKKKITQKYVYWSEYDIDHYFIQSMFFPVEQQIEEDNNENMYRLHILPS